MVQLSAPSPDLIPVQNGKSSEKAPGPINNSDGFKRALRKEKEGRDTDHTGEAAVRKGRAPEEGRSENANPTEASFRVASEGPLKKTALKGLEKKSGTEGQDVKKVLFARKSVDSHSEKIELLQKDHLLKNPLAKTLLKNKKSETEGKGESNTAVFNEEKALTAGVQVQELLKKDMNPDDPVRTVRTTPAVQGKEDQPLPSGPAAVPVSFTKTAVLQGQEPRGKNLLLQKDGKKSDKGEVKISVEDRRTVHGRDKNPLLLKEIETGDAPNRVTLELVPSDDVSGMVTRGDQGDSTGRSFVLQTAEEQKGAALLDRQLQDRGTQELTKNIRFVLKDHNEGEIKLILKPEALGKVRINLNLHENHIVGKIIVENNSVRQAFMNNLADLTKALEESGFNTASLDVSVGGGQTQGRQQNQNEHPVYFTDSSLSSLDDQIPVVYEQGGTLSQINMMA